MALRELKKYVRGVCRHFFVTKLSEKNLIFLNKKKSSKKVKESNVRNIELPLYWKPMCN